MAHLPTAPPRLKGEADHVPDHPRGTLQNGAKEVMVRQVHIGVDRRDDTLSVLGDLPLDPRVVRRVVQQHDLEHERQPHPRRGERPAQRVLAGDLDHPDHAAPPLRHVVGIHDREPALDEHRLQAVPDVADVHRATSAAPA